MKTSFLVKVSSKSHFFHLAARVHLSHFEIVWNIWLEERSVPHSDKDPYKNSRGHRWKNASKIAYQLWPWLFDLIAHNFQCQIFDTRYPVHTWRPRVRSSRPDIWVIHINTPDGDRVFAPEILPLSVETVHTPTKTAHPPAETARSWNLASVSWRLHVWDTYNTYDIISEYSMSTFWHWKPCANTWRPSISQWKSYVCPFRWYLWEIWKLINENMKKSYPKN